MSIRFLADEDVDMAIVRGLRSREPSIDILDVKTAGLRGTKDSDLLKLAASQGRIMISHDRESMSRDFCKRLVGKLAPGLFIVPQHVSAIGRIVDSMLLVWAASEPDEWRDRIAYLPFK